MRRTHIAAIVAMSVLACSMVVHGETLIGWGSVKALYGSGETDRARMAYRSEVNTCRANVVAWLPKTNVRSGLLAGNVKGLVELYKNATKWENANCKAGPVSANALKQVELARRALTDIRTAVLKHAKSDRTAAIAAAADKALRDAIGDEVAMLEKAGQKDKAKALRDRYGAFIASEPVLPPSPGPDSQAFIEMSCTAPGPLQPVLACYAMGQPEAGRVRMIEKLVSMRAKVRDAIARGALTAEITARPVV